MVSFRRLAQTQPRRCSAPLSERDSRIDWDLKGLNKKLSLAIKEGFEKLCDDSTLEGWKNCFMDRYLKCENTGCSIQQCAYIHRFNGPDEVRCSLKRRYGSHLPDESGGTEK